MAEYAELEIGLQRRDADSYAVDFRFSQPDSEADVRLGQGHAAKVNFDFDALRKLTLAPEDYGRQLADDFFADPVVRSAFAQVRATVQTLGMPLRLRLSIAPNAPELHGLRWETLRDPEENTLLATSENILLSRYLSSQDWRPVRLQALGDLRAAVVVASPSNLPEYGLAPVDAESEFSRAREGLGEIPLDPLPDSKSGSQATLNDIALLLRAEVHDILYLVCHGAFDKGEPWLWLEDEQGKVALNAGTELVARLKELRRQPRLLVLASCESAAAGSNEALSALGPRLAEAGVPAVLAMQGKISMQTIATFMPAFFRELKRDGQIDRAVAVARGEVRDRPDHWMPALFMRLKSGRIWYVAGFGDDRGEIKKWRSLVSFIRDKTCTPILGPGLVEAVLDSRREIALRWAEKHGFPLSPNDKDSLPRVAQYIVTRQSPAYLPVAYREALRDSVLSRYSADLPSELVASKAWTSSQLIQALEVAADSYTRQDPNEPYRLAAKLRLPIYITAGTLDLMTYALMAEGAEPVVRICKWNKWIPDERALYDDEPTPEKPLVYHLFGHVSIPNSLVYSEDNFFDFLIGMTTNKSLIPSVVRAALTNTSLLFLGHQMDDWEFRIFFRFLIAQEGHELLRQFTHAAVQLEPEEDRIVDVERTRNFLEEYFESENFQVYWGSSQDFLRALWQHIGEV